jgi:3-oxoacyl-[acyl-carrier-protein] synthase-1
MMSGFGGCNAAILFRHGETDTPQQKITSQPVATCEARIVHSVHLTERSLTVDGEEQTVEGCGMDMLKWLYHNRVGDYPKYYKMDPMTKLGFLASELLLAAEGGERFAERTDRAVVIVGRSSSICADRLYQQTIQDADNYFPSPAAFIYTLPNIVAGEIAIRNIYRNETLYVAHESADGVIPLMTQMLTAPGVESVVGGWVEMEDTGSFDATLYIIE